MESDALLDSTVFLPLMPVFGRGAQKYVDAFFRGRSHADDAALILKIVKLPAPVREHMILHGLLSLRRVDVQLAGGEDLTGENLPGADESDLSGGDATNRKRKFLYALLTAMLVFFVLLGIGSYKLAQEERSAKPVFELNSVLSVASQLQTGDAANFNAAFDFVDSTRSQLMQTENEFEANSKLETFRTLVFQPALKNYFKWLQDVRGISIDTRKLAGTDLDVPVDLASFQSLIAEEFAAAWQTCAHFVRCDLLSGTSDTAATLEVGGRMILCKSVSTCRTPALRDYARAVGLPAGVDELAVNLNEEIFKACIKISVATVVYGQRGSSQSRVLSALQGLTQSILPYASISSAPALQALVPQLRLQNSYLLDVKRVIATINPDYVATELTALIRQSLPTSGLVSLVQLLTTLFLTFVARDYLGRFSLPRVAQSIARGVSEIISRPYQIVPVQQAPRLVDIPVVAPEPRLRREARRANSRPRAALQGGASSWFFQQKPELQGAQLQGGVKPQLQGGANIALYAFLTILIAHMIHILRLSTGSVLATPYSVSTILNSMPPSLAQYVKTSRVGDLSTSDELEAACRLAFPSVGCKSEQVTATSTELQASVGGVLSSRLVLQRTSPETFIDQIVSTIPDSSYFYGNYYATAESITQLLPGVATLKTENATLIAFAQREYARNGLRAALQYYTNQATEFRLNAYEQAYFRGALAILRGSPTRLEADAPAFQDALANSLRYVYSSAVPMKLKYEYEVIRFYRQISTVGLVPTLVARAKVNLFPDLNVERTAAQASAQVLSVLDRGISDIIEGKQYSVWTADKSSEFARTFEFFSLPEGLASTTAIELQNQALAKLSSIYFPTPFSEIIRDSLKQELENLASLVASVRVDIAAPVAILFNTILLQIFLGVSLSILATLQEKIRRQPFSAETLAAVVSAGVVYDTATGGSMAGAATSAAALIAALGVSKYRKRNLKVQQERKIAARKRVLYNELFEKTFKLTDARRSGVAVQDVLDTMIPTIYARDEELRRLETAVEKSDALLPLTTAVATLAATGSPAIATTVGGLLSVSRLISPAELVHTTLLTIAVYMSTMQRFTLELLSRTAATEQEIIQMQDWLEFAQSTLYGAAFMSNPVLMQSIL